MAAFRTENPVKSMDKTSRQFKWLSFFACIWVLIIHSRSYQRLPDPGMSVLLVQYFVGQALARFSVPAFFIISGYWWAKHVSGSPLAGYGALLKKKWKTLVIPYLCWGAIGAVLSFGLTGTANLLTHQPLLARSAFDADGFFPLLDKIFGIVSSAPLGNGPLWFLRQLIFIFVLTPLVLLLLRGGRLLSIAVAIALVIAGWTLPDLPYSPIMITYLGWFIFGAVISRTDFVTRELPVSLGVSSVVLWLGSSALRTAEQLHVVTFSSFEMALVLTVIGLSGTLTFWMIAARCAPKALPPMVDNLFFVYCFHNFSANLLVTAFHVVFHKQNWEAHVSFVLAPFFAFGICYLAFRVLESVAPRLLRVLTGGR